MPFFQIKTILKESFHLEIHVQYMCIFVNMGKYLHQKSGGWKAGN
jgi:hypothetical protein